MSGDRRRKVFRPVSRHETKTFLAAPSGPWIPISLEMLNSHAYRALSRAGHQVIARLTVEHLSHGGCENGRLAVGWSDLVAAGVHRSMIPQALDEVERLGFVRCTDKGRRGYGSAIGRRATYRLTFAGVIGDESSPATNEWRMVETEAEARAILMQVRDAERRRKAKAGKGQDGPQARDIERGTEYRTGAKVRNTVLGKLAS